MAGLEDVRAVGQLERHGSILLHEQDRQASLRQATNRARDLRHHDRRQPERRLVEQQVLRLRHEAAGDGEHLLLAAGERAAELSAPLAQAREKVVARREIGGEVAPVSALVGPHQKIVEHGELGKDLAALGDEDQAPPHALEGRPTGDIDAIAADGARRRRLESRDGAKGRALARRVGPDDGDDLPGPHGQAHVAQHVRLAVVAVDAIKLEHGWSRGTPRRPWDRRGPDPADPRRSSRRDRGR